MLQLNFTPFPVLTTERLILREITEQDIHELYALRSNPEVMKYIARPLAKTLDDVRELIKTMKSWLDKNEWINWAITLKGGDKLIGNIGFFRTDMANYRSEIGYMLQPNFHRQGIMDEALKACVSFAFSQMKLHSIEAVTAPENMASENILLKNGFEVEGLFKENFYYDGKFLDSKVFSLLTPLK